MIKVGNRYALGCGFSIIQKSVHKCQCILESCKNSHHVIGCKLLKFAVEFEFWQPSIGSHP